MITKLTPPQLRIVTNASELGFTTTDDLIPGLPCLGQERAVEALRAGLSIPGPGFHILALGAEGIGRTDCILSVLGEFTPSSDATSDRCLLPVPGQYGTFVELDLPPGRGQVLIEGCAEVVRAVQTGDGAGREQCLANLKASFADDSALDEFFSILAEESALLLAGDGSQADIKPLLQKFPQCIVQGETQGIPFQIDRSPDPASLLGSCMIDPETGKLLVNAGSLVQASGGCLLINGRLLAENIAWWRTLRDVLRTGYLPLSTLQPVQPMQYTAPMSLSGYLPLTTKVILLCDLFVLDRLQEIEPDMERIFPVIAEFDTRVRRTPRSIVDSANIMAASIRTHGCLPFSREAMAAMLDISSRIAGARDRLSLYRSALSNLLREASHIAHLRGHEIVTAAEVEAVIEQRKKRVEIAKQESIQAILTRETLVELSGVATGQVNGLTVVGSGVQAYVEPARITAAVRAGEGSIIDIERETDLGGSIHSKGVLILAGLLGSRYARHEPLSLIASLVVEQNYSELDGDSASLAEMLALLSAIASIPVNQSIAVTGSIDQRGQIQCIGDVVMKIEGFFDLCQQAGLDGRHGVVIPSGNTNDLVLDKNVVEAVEHGLFSVYAVRELDQAIELMTAMPAGSADEQGRFPPDSFNHAVSAAVHRYAEEKKQQEHKED